MALLHGALAASRLRRRRRRAHRVLRDAAPRARIAAVRDARAAGAACRRAGGRGSCAPVAGVSCGKRRRAARLDEDLVVDHAAAAAELGWSPRDIPSRAARLDAAAAAVRRPREAGTGALHQSSEVDFSRRCNVANARLNGLRCCHQGTSSAGATMQVRSITAAGRRVFASDRGTLHEARAYDYTAPVPFHPVAGRSIRPTAWSRFRTICCCSAPPI